MPFLKLLGMCCLKVVDGEDVVKLASETEHMNSWGMAHGDVTTTMLDVIMVTAGRSADVHGRGVVIIEMKATFMQPGCGMLKASAHCVYRPAAVVFCGGEVCDADDKLVTRDSGTFRFVRCMSPPCTSEPGMNG